MITSKRVPVFLACLFLWSAHAFGQCQYEVTAVIQGPECPFAGPPATTGRAINDDRHVVGWYRKCDFSGDIAFRWTPESGFEELDLPVDNVTSARAMDINNNGAICGWYTAKDNGEFFQASFVLTEDGQFINIPAVKGAGQIQAQAINDSQQVVGWRLSRS